MHVYFSRVKLDKHVCLLLKIKDIFWIFHYNWLSLGVAVVEIKCFLFVVTERVLNTNREYI